MATSVEAATSSYAEEMIKELAQLEDLEISATGMILEGITIVTGESSSQSSLPKDLPYLDPQLGKRTKIFHTLPFLLLLLILML